MVDLIAIKGAVDGLKAARDIAKTAIGLRDAALLQDKVVELNDAIISAQSSALDAQAEQFTLVERVGDLEKEIARSKTWDTEKQRYSLVQFAPGVVAYALKKSEARGEPGHALCANCYERGVKSILQSNGDPYIDDHAFECSSCNTAIKTPRDSPPEFAD